MSESGPNDGSGLDKPQVRRSFERAARTYDGAAVLQREIAERLSARLELIRLQPRVILDLGSGTGYGMRLLARRYRAALVAGLDIAYSMAAHARARSGRFARLRRRPTRFVCGDAERLPFAAATADLVFSNLSLQWCRPELVFAEVRRVLRPGGLFLFTTFGPDTLCEVRAAWRAVDERPHVHTFFDLHDVGDLLVRSGFADPVMDVEQVTLTYPDVAAVLRDLKRVGAHNLSTRRQRGLTGKARFNRFHDAYAAQAAAGRIPATYEVVYGHAWAPGVARVAPPARRRVIR